MAVNSPSLILRAAQSSKLLPLLLPTCKTIESARLELQWIREELPKEQWLDACTQRGKGRPLQYILGSQPFAEIDIKCEEGVLIPRWETEEWTLRLTRLLDGMTGLKAVDICTGTGCIPLLMSKRLNGEFTGIDISDKCVSLSEVNKLRNSLDDVRFIQGDLFNWDQCETVDIVTSNPPYISISDYGSSETETSVRLYEPKLALVGGNEFFEALIRKVVIPSKAQGFVFELGYKEQYEFTKRILPPEWECKLYYDGNGKERCVVGWIKSGKFEQLHDF